MVYKNMYVLLCFSELYRISMIFSFFFNKKFRKYAFLTCGFVSIVDFLLYQVFNLLELIKKYTIYKYISTRIHVEAHVNVQTFVKIHFEYVIYFISHERYNWFNTITLVKFKISPKMYIEVIHSKIFIVNIHLIKITKLYKQLIIHYIGKLQYLMIPFLALVYQY